MVNRSRQIRRLVSMTPAEASFIDRAWKAAGYQSWQAFMLDKASASAQRILNKEQTR